MSAEVKHLTKILITGSRDFPKPQVIREILISCQKKFGNITIIHGDCGTGADFFASIICDELKISQIKVPAEWKLYGKSAGPKRNQVMVNLKPSLCYAFSDDIQNSKGTKDTLSRVIKAKIGYYLFNSKAEIVEYFLFDSKGKIIK